MKQTACRRRYDHGEVTTAVDPSSELWFTELLDVENAGAQLPVISMAASNFETRSNNRCIESPRPLCSRSVSRTVHPFIWVPQRECLRAVQDIATVYVWNRTIVDPEANMASSDLAGDAYYNCYQASRTPKNSLFYPSIKSHQISKLSRREGRAVYRRPIMMRR